MAQIEKRGPYQWRARVRKKGWGQQSKTFETKAAAQAWAATIESKIIQGRLPFPTSRKAEKTTLNEALDRYSDNVTSKKRGRRQEEHRIGIWKKSFLANYYLSAIDNSKIAKYRNARLEEGKSANTVRLELALLSHLFEEAKREWGFSTLSNPVKEVTKPPRGEPRDRRLAKEEEERLFLALDQCRNPLIKPIVIVAIETAMRQGEILSLTWNNIDLVNQVARLPITKNGTSREVPLSKTAKKTLAKLPKPHDGLKHVFQLSQNALIIAYRSAVARAGIHNLTFHDLRHEATSRLFEKGLNLMEVATITGHKDLSMLRRYTHLRAKDLAKKLD